MPLCANKMPEYYIHCKSLLILKKYRFKRCYLKGCEKNYSLNSEEML